MNVYSTNSDTMLSNVIICAIEATLIHAPNPQHILICCESSEKLNCIKSMLQSWENRFKRSPSMNNSNKEATAKKSETFVKKKIKYLENEQNEQESLHNVENSNEQYPIMYFHTINDLLMERFAWSYSNKMDIVFLVDHDRNIDEIEALIPLSFARRKMFAFGVSSQHILHDSRKTFFDIWTKNCDPLILL